MRAYIGHDKMSFRFACACCSTKHGHGTRTDRASETKTRAKRMGRKAARQAGKKEATSDSE